jgi:vacuolar iron transporter family protein
MALEVIEQKKELIESRARIREFVFGIQDGLMSTLGLLTGVQGACESSAVVIITGPPAMFSGAISMAAGSYLSSRDCVVIEKKCITVILSKAKNLTFPATY